MQKNPDDVTEKEEYEMDEKKPTNKKKGNKVNKVNGNPLHWFGVLVSPSLRTSQEHFQTALTHLIDMANLVHDIENLEQQYKALKKDKQARIQEANTTTLVDDD
ncbi:uncharacterized protein BX664DRAFT_195937 [Halteromyces radiatus]|uniref:uncharacterized protein n=1 Tax=Halteromyces radiatus TaxID=101107 RepID=UPI00221FA9AF|nr:uncharacterized protein BX664DRAFT_195937 [Halteromyces radiatus]KAI8081542.1 hypothetical protein BX664DRAFT_195937 [Halteromyces radiatus]